MIYSFGRASTICNRYNLACFGSGSTSKGDLACISGVLSWISFVFIPGKSRRQHIYDAAGLGATGKKSDVVQIEGPLQRQLRWWRYTLSRGGSVGTRI